MKRRVVSMMMALAMTTGLLAGCGSGQDGNEDNMSSRESSASSQEMEESGEASQEAAGTEDPFHITDEAVTFTFASAMPTNWGDASEKQFFQDMEDKTNVHIEWNQFPLEVAAERVGIMMAGSSELPDAFYTHNNFSLAQANTYGYQGLLMDLKPLIEEHAPHIKECFDEINGWKEYAADNGAIYCLPKIEVGFPESVTVHTELIINTDMLKETGLSMPSTTDEFYEVLKAMKGMTTEDGKEVIPFSFGLVYGYGDMLMGAFGLVDSTSGNYLMYDGESVTAIADTDNYKEYIKYMNKLASEGLMDVEVYTHDNNMFTSKGQAGQLGSFVDYGGWNIAGQSKIEDGTYAVVPVLAGPDGTKLTQNRYTVIRNACDFAMTKDCKDPVTLIKYIDLFYNQDLDVAFESTYGPRGYNWDYNEEGILTKFPVPEEFSSYGDFRASETIPAGPLWIGEKLMAKQQNEGVSAIKAQMDEEGGYNEAAIYPVLPILVFTEEETEELAILKTDLIEYIKNFEAGCIMGRQDVEAEWENHLKTLDSLGMEKLQSIYSAALERYKSK